MFNLFLIILSAIFLLFSIVDILLHKKKSIKRGMPGFIFLCILICSCLATGYFGISNTMMIQSNNASQKYLAVKYLAVGNVEQARKYINTLPDISNSEKYYKTVLGMIADGTNGSYSSVIEKAVLLDSTTNLTTSQKNQIFKLSDISKKIIASQNDSPEYSELAAQAQDLFNDTTNRLFKDFNISDSIRLTYDAVYTLDDAVAKQQFTQQTEQIAADLIKNNSSEDTYKAVIKYFFAQGDLIKAEEIARSLVEKHSTIGNKIIYTDILTQQVRNSLTSQNYDYLENDPEAQKLISKADELKTQADVYDKLIYNETNQEKRDKYISEKSRLLNQAEDLNKEASLITVRRAINFLIKSKPLFGDKSGMVNMQIAKLYFAVDDIERSREYVHKVLDSGNRISSDSVIKNDVTAINDALESSKNSGIPSEELFVPAVNNIINKISQNIVPAEQATINEEFENSVVSELKYNNLQLYVSKVDYSSFPNIKAYANVSGQKDRIFGLANDYSDKDFVLTDTNYKIQNFKLTKNSTDDGASIALILDHSGSMQGRPFEDAKLAVLSCLDNKSSKENFSVVTYSDNASIISGLNNDVAVLKSAVNLINYPDGGTNISDGLFKGIETLSSVNGTKAMILLSDGMDNKSEEGSLEKVLQYAKSNGIAIFTVGLGEFDESYMRKVAEQTGAAFFRADNTTQLYDIYRLLQKYIVNNYVFEYKVEKNPNLQVRKCDVLLENEGVSGVKFYNLGGGDIPKDEETYDALYQDPNSLWIEQVNPSSMTTSKIGKNTKIKVTGKNFDKEMRVMIGSYYSKNVKVISSTEAEVLLPEALTPGFYSITVENTDGNRKTNEMAFSLFRPGLAKKLKVGSIDIEANTIGQTNATTFVASGNVIINGFLRSSTDVFISTNSPLKLDYSNADVIDLAPTGVISGNGKLYASYSKTKEDGSKNNFAAVALAGKDYVVKSGKYNINVNELDAAFDDNQASVFKLKLPGIVDLTVGQARIVSDGIEVKAYEGSDLTLIEALSEALRGTDAKSKSNATVLGVSQKKTSFSLEELSFKIAKEDILVKASVGIKNPIKLPAVEGTDLELTIDNISGDKWISISGGFDLDVDAPRFSGLKMEVSSYQLSLNKIEIMVQLGSGIAIDPYKLIRVFEVGGGVDEIAKGLKGFEIYFKAEAGIKVSSILGVEEKKVPKILSKVDKVLMLSNMELRVQPISKLSVSSDLKVFDTKMMDVKMSVSKDGYEAVGTVTLDTDFLGIIIDMYGKDEIYINKNGFYKTVSGNIKQIELPFIDVVRDKQGLLAFSIANSRLMLEIEYQNEYAKVVFDFDKGAWGFIPKVNVNVN